MKIGAWIRGHDLPLESQIATASENGPLMIRSCSIEYSRKAASFLKHHQMSLLAGMRVDAEALAADWRSQVRLDEIVEIHALDVLEKYNHRLCCVKIFNTMGQGTENEPYTSVRADFLTHLEN